MASDDSVVGRLIQTARMCRTMRAELLARHGLYAGQDVLLKTLKKDDGSTMGALALALGVRPPTVTKMVSRMAAQGLLERKASKSDSRQTLVYLTKPGRKLVKRIDKIWKKADTLALGNLSEKQLTRLEKSLKRISSGLETQELKRDKK